MTVFLYSVNDHLVLRQLRLTDADELYALVDVNRTYLRQWLPWLDPRYSVESSRDFIQYTLDQFAQQFGIFAAVCEDERMVGTVSLNQIDLQNRSGYVGYWLAESHQGRGLMTASCRVMVRHAFSELKLNRLAIYCASGNWRSRAIPERLGFLHEGTAREAAWLHDRFVDLEIYSLLNRDWLR